MYWCTLSHSCVLIFLVIITFAADHVLSQQTDCGDEVCPQIITLTYDADQKPVLQCECKQYGQCHSTEVVKFAGDENLCNDQECCTLPITNSAREECRCLKNETCIYEQGGAGIIKIRLQGDQEPYCGSERTCCKINYDTPGSTSDPDPNQHSFPDADVKNKPFPSLPQNIKCGMRGYVRGIIVRNGATENSETIFGEFPWMVMIIRKGRTPDEDTQICAGTIISENIVLTAAHCFNSNVQDEKDQLIIRAGEYDPNSSKNEYGSYQEISVKKVIIHPDFHLSTLYNDYALIQVKKGFNWTENVGPICWDNDLQESTYDKTKCVATGWGKKKLSEMGQLQKAEMSIIDSGECGRLYRTKGGLQKFFQLHSSFVCAVGQDNSNTCKVDGGAALACATYKDPNQYVQVGILSWDIDCHRKELPTSFASLKQAMTWITLQFNVLEIFV